MRASWRSACDAALGARRTSSAPALTVCPAATATLWTTPSNGTVYVRAEPGSATAVPKPSKVLGIGPSRTT